MYDYLKMRKPGNAWCLPNDGSTIVRGQQLVDPLNLVGPMQ